MIVVVTDVIFLAIMVAFFAVAVLFVKGCELIVGPDTLAARDDEAEPETPERAAA